MNDDRDVEVLATTQEAMAKEEHPIESFKTLTLDGPEGPATPKVSAPTLVCPFLPLFVQNLLTS
jgi:hypothetical protein